MFIYVCMYAYIYIYIYIISLLPSLEEYISSFSDNRWKRFLYRFHLYV